jgi:hypothetical protein
MPVGCCFYVCDHRWVLPLPSSGRSPLNQPDNQHDNRYNQEDMNKTSGHMTDKSKKPEHD